MSIFYPRKQTVVIAAVCIVAVTAVAYYTHRNASATSSQLDVASDGAGTIEPISATAGSSDAGSASSTQTDWRKQFTDSSAPSANKVATRNASSSQDTGPLTMTDQLGRDTFTSYVQLKEADLLGNSGVMDQTASDLVTKNIASAQPRTYTVKDLTIIPSSDQASLTAFASSVEAAVELYDAKESESAIMSDYTNTNDSTVLTRIDPIIVTYKRIIAGLLAIPTPQTVSTDELSLVNSFSSLEFAAESLRATDTDTIRGIAGVSAHVSGVDQLTNFLTMQSDLQLQGTPFILNNETAFNILLN